MTKRRVERDIEDLSEEILSKLSPTERLQLWLQAAAQNNKDWIARLRETAPVNRYWTTNLAFVERGKAALRFLDHAIYNLHTTALWFKLLEMHQYTQWMVDVAADRRPSDDDLDQASDREDRILYQFADLYTCYHAYRQFATDVLGVELETWFELHPDGEDILAMIDRMLSDELHFDLPEELLNDVLTTQATDSGEVEWISLDKIAEQRYQAYVASWKDMLAMIPE